MRGDANPGSAGAVGTSTQRASGNRRASVSTNNAASSAESEGRDSGAASPRYTSYVLDSKTDAPIANATVTLVGFHDKIVEMARTDAEGRFGWKTMPHQVCKIRGPSSTPTPGVR